MYEAFFKLQKKPFELVPDPAMLFASRGHRKALSYLEYGFSEGAGFILLTGEVGSGKTTLIRNLVQNLDRNTSRAMIFNTLVNSEQLLAMINEEFGLDAGGKGKVALLRELNDYLVDQYAQNCRPMVIIDEAQNLSAQALEEIRLLSNLELDAAKLLQIILVGQPELKELVAQPCLRQLRQRISINCHLKALDREETEAYIYHRLEKAGNREAASFAPGTFDLIFEASRGVPRLINTCCDFVLLTAFIEETHELDFELVQEVLDELDIGSHSGQVTSESSQSAELDSQGLTTLVARSEIFQDRLDNHEKVLRKVVRAQQSQNQQLGKALEEINARLKGISPKGANESLISPVRVVEGRGPG